MDDKDLITKLLWLFESKKFANWYADTGRFGKYINGDLQQFHHLSHQECVKIIREDIAGFLQLNKD